MFLDDIRKKAKTGKKIIVLPESNNDKILKAANKIVKERIAKIILIGNEEEIKKIAKKNKIKIDSEIINIINPENYPGFEKFVSQYYEMRKEKGISLEEARNTIKQPHFFGAMLVQNGIADGMVSGINSATKPYYPAFQIIGTKEGISRASGLFFMVKGKEIYLFADCALNMNPDSRQLAEIALSSVETAKEFRVKPKVAMLSFSTKGSAKHEMVDKVRNATEIVKNKMPNLIIDGEIQLDAAIVKEVCIKKCPGSPLKGEANLLIFPDLNAGNIGYKLVERFAGYNAIGPIMQGLKKPINDLSRGCSVDNIVSIVAITAIQSI